jgi:hypothetical protein
VNDQELTQQVETAIARLERLQDPQAREAARNALSAVLELHRAGLERILERLPQVQLAALSTEPLVSSLLVLHELHPKDLLSRVLRAVDTVKPMLALNGAAAAVELDGEDVRVTLRRGEGCGTVARLKEVLEQAVSQVAPDARSIRIVEQLA